MYFFIYSMKYIQYKICIFCLKTSIYLFKIFFYFLQHVFRAIYKQNNIFLMSLSSFSIWSSQLLFVFFGDLKRSFLMNNCSNKKTSFTARGYRYLQQVLFLYTLFKSGTWKLFYLFNRWKGNDVFICIEWRYIQISSNVKCYRKYLFFGMETRCLSQLF